MGTAMSPVRFKFLNVKFVTSVVLFIGFLCQNINAAAVCNEGCPSANKPGNLVFVPGNVYTYDLNSDITIYLSGNDAQQTTIKLQGQAQLYAEQNCRYALKLNKVFVFGPDHKRNQLGNELQLGKLVRFTMANDEIGTEICAEDTDTEFSLNLKRAIISMIQSATTKRTETDVFGICPTTFSSTKSADTLIVTKVRNLNACGYRESLATGLITGIFDENSEIKTTPVLNGDYTNEQRIKNGILENVQINEEYQYIPFSSGEAGARSKVVSKLHLKGSQTGEAPKQTDGRPKSILFENPQPQVLSNINTLKNALKQSIANYQNTVGSKAASQFVELIRLMRFTRKDDLLALYQQVKAGTVHNQKELARKIYFDALFRTGTSESIQVIGNLLRNEMTAKEQHLAYLSLNLVKSIDETGLTSINKLLDGNPPREAYLSVGNLVNKFCRDHGCESNEIKSISEKFVNKLGDCKADNRKKENTVVAVLKGIRNTNNLVSPAMDKVVQCTSEKYSTRIRVAALQAFSAGACHKKVHNAALNILKNRQEDAELRIEAYLALVACPSGNVANEIKAVLDEETVYQVGAFISSHLANLRSSTDLYRESARQYFANIRSSQKFPADFRRYSFNQEFSYAIGSLGLGASADATVIYSQKEFLPRSTRFNLTGEIFGNSFNILEVAARQENLDLLLEHYFGPKGLFKSADLQQLYDTYVGGEKKRDRRSIREDVQQFGKDTHIHNEALNDIDYDISFKLFGTEMYFLSLGDDLTFEPGDFLKKFKECLDKAVTDAKGFDQKFESHALFLDADLVYPTGVGFPLKLNLQGSSVVRFEMTGKIDFKKISDDPKNAKFTLKIVPSYNLDITGALTVDGYVVSTGIQVSGSVHSSTGAELDFALLNDGNGVDVNVRLPFKKQEIFSFEQKTVFITLERGQETVTNNMKFTSKKDEFVGCFDQLSRYIGATFCTSVSVTIPGTPGVALFPLNGGNRASVYLEMDEAYSFKALYEKGDHPSLELAFDTPGSDVARKTKVKFEVSTTPKPYAKITLDSAHKKASIEGGYSNDPKEMVFFVNAVNEPDQYHGKIGFSKSGAAPKEIYTPIVLLQTPNREDDNLFGYKVTGNVLVDSSKSPVRYNFNQIKMIGPDPEPIAVNGWIDVAPGGSKVNADLALTKGNKKGTFAGGLEYTLWSTVHFDFGVTSNFNEHANGKLKFDIERGDKNLKTNVIFIYGSDFASTTKRFEFAQDYSFDITDKKVLTAIKFNNKLSAPFVPFNVRLDGEYNEKLVKYLLEAGYSKYKIGSNLDAKFNSKTDGEYDINFGVSLNQHNAKVVAKRDIDTAADKSRLTNKFVCSTGTRVELNGMVSNNPTITNTDIHLDGLLILTDGQEPYKLAFILLLTPEKANANGKILHGSTELMAYDAKINRDGNNRNGELDINVKNFLTGKGTFKADGGGKGEATLTLDVQKLNRKVKVDSKFNVAAPVYDFVNEFYYDYEKDNTKKITFETKNKMSKQSFNTQNTLDIQTEQYQFNGEGQRDGSIDDGKMTSKFALVLPSKRQFGAEFDREVNLKTPKATGKGRIKLVDTLPDRKFRSVSVDTKLTDGDYKAKLFQFFVILEYVDFNGKNVVLDTNFKNLPNGHYKVAAAAVTARGSLLSEVIDLLISADEYCPEHAVYRATAKYGGQLNANINGNYYVGGRGKPGTYDFSAQINIPNTKIKSIRLQSNAKYLTPQTADGLYEGQFKVSGSLDDKTLSLDTTAKGNGKHGSGNININLPESDPIGADGSYSFEGDLESETHSTVSLKCQYGKGKVVKVSGDLKRIPGKEAIFHGQLQTPLEHAKIIDITYKGSRPTETSRNYESEIKVDDKIYGFKSNLAISTENPEIDVVFTYPGKQSKFYAGATRLGERKYKGKLQIENFGDFNLLATTEMNYQNADTFFLIVDADAPKINVNKVHLEVNAKQNPGSKGIEFKASAQDKNVLSGYADYTIKEEKGKTVIEGQGNVKLYDKEKAASFKFQRNMIEDVKDGEKGVHLVFNSLLGARNIVAELRLTNKVFQVRNTICEEKNQCINFEVKSVIRQNPPKNYKHELLVTVDLRKIGYAYEFGLQSDTEREGFTLKHNFDMQLQAQDKTKYQYKAYANPSNAGVVLTLPSRVIAIESVYSIPKEVFGRYDVSISSYLDKQNKPQSKATLGFLIDLNRPKKNVINSRGELKFSHPSVRELKIVGQTDFNGDAQTASGRLELDLFKNADQAILIVGKYGNSEPSSIKAFNVSSELSVSSRGLGFEYGFNGHAAASLDRRQVSVAGSLASPSADLRCGLYLFSSDSKLELIVTGFNEELFHADGQFDTNKMNALIKSKIQFLGTQPVNAELNIQGFTTFLINLSRDKLLKINGEFSVGKEASLLFVGSGKELFRARVALDQTHFLASEYKVNDNDIKEFVKQAQDEVKKDTERARKDLANRLSKTKETMEKQFDNLKNSIPDFEPIKDEYKQQWDKLVDELMADKTIKEFVDFFNRVYGTIGKTIVEIVKVLIENTKKVLDIFKEFYKKLVDAFNDKILPALKETYSKLENILPRIYEDTIHLIGVLFERIAKALKTFEDDFEKLGKSLSEAFKSFATIFTKYFEIIRKEVYDLYGFITTNIKELPGFEYLKDKFNTVFGGLIVPENIVNVLKEITNTLKDTLPTNELDEFVQNLFNYIESKLTNKKVNDWDVLKSLYVSLVKAIRSVIELIRAQYGELSTATTGGTSNYFGPVPFSLAALKRLPHLSSFRFSPWNYFRNEDSRSLRELFYTYRPYGFNPMNFLPPFAKRATIIDGEHILTFDGRHITFPGTCQYVLAQDLVNGNFSLVANLANGKLKSITLIDKGDFIEFTSDGQTNLNGKPSEFPIHKSNMHAWRGYYTLSMLTQYGVLVVCAPNLKICHITVNGFYHDKVRGLLGNGNNEPNDDFQLLNGKIAQNSAEFGNAYKVQKSCAAIPYTDHSHAHSDVCTQTFSWDSPLRYCYYFIDPAQYREACDHALVSVADGDAKEQAACDFARAYASACAQESIPARIPKVCAKCDGKYEFGDDYEVTAPQKKADIVIVVDTSLGPLLGEFVQPLIADLRKELKSRDITDSQISVIGYNPDEKYVNHFTSNGQLDFVGKFNAIKLDEQPKIGKPLRTNNEKIDKYLADAYNYVRNVEKDLGLAADGRAFREAMAYPFRSTASNVIIAIRPDQLEYSVNPLKFVGAVYSNTLAQLSGVLVHVIAPVDDLKLKKDTKNTKNIVGFSNKAVVLMSDFKKRGSLGSQDLRGQLECDSDMGIDLVLDGDGYVFPLNNYQQFKNAKEKKQFIATIASTLAEQSARTEVKYTCICNLLYGIIPNEVCIAEDIKLLPEKKRTGRMHRGE